MGASRVAFLIECKKKSPLKRLPSGDLNDEACKIWDKGTPSREGRKCKGSGIHVFVKRERMVTEEAGKHQITYSQSGVCSLCSEMGNHWELC